jgi:hypothetical protein
MGAYVFNNQPFDSWLNKKSDDILSKVDREMITTEEMIILVLKAQTNHFYHTDIDLKKGLSDLDHKIESSIANLDHKIESSRIQLEEKINNLDRKLESSVARLDQKIETSIAHLDEKIVYLDRKIDNRFMWMIGITIVMSGGIYLKLFLG